jgi:hypothetical protein
MVQDSKDHPPRFISTDTSVDHVDTSFNPVDTSLDTSLDTSVDQVHPGPGEDVNDVGDGGHSFLDDSLEGSSSFSLPSANSEDAFVCRRMNGVPLSQLSQLSELSRMDRMRQIQEHARMQLALQLEQPRWAQLEQSQLAQSEMRGYEEYTWGNQDDEGRGMLAAPRGRSPDVSLSGPLGASDISLSEPYTATSSTTASSDNRNPRGQRHNRRSRRSTSDGSSKGRKRTYCARDVDTDDSRNFSFPPAEASFTNLVSFSQLQLA